jgi:hypothetical protein
MSIVVLLCQGLVFQVTDDPSVQLFFTVLIILVLVGYHVFKIVIVLVRRKKRLLLFPYAKISSISKETLYEVYWVHSERVMKKDGALYVNKNKLLELLSKTTEEKVTLESESLKQLLMTSPRLLPYRSIGTISLPRIGKSSLVSPVEPQMRSTIGGLNA